MGVTGIGTALAEILVEQDAAYWEVKVAKMGTRCQIGVAYDLTGNLLQSQIGGGENSWSVGSGAGGAAFASGDVIGIAYGQGDIPNLRFFHNGQPLGEATVNRVRGEAYPAVSVDDGTELVWIFDP